MRFLLRYLKNERVFNFYTNKNLDYVKKFATEEALRDQEQAESSDSESSMSDFSEDEAQDMEL